MSRILDFADGFESSSAPIILDTSISGDLAVSGNAVIAGNLTVQGTTVTLNTATLDVEDINITVNKNGNDASSEGAGITVDRTSTDGSLVFDSTKTSKWKLGLSGSEVEVADISSAQSFSNKTINADLNTKLIS